MIPFILDTALWQAYDPSRFKMIIAKSRFEREKEHKDGSKAVCKKHERAYVVAVGCPYCE